MADEDAEDGAASSPEGAGASAGQAGSTGHGSAAAAGSEAADGGSASEQELQLELAWRRAAHRAWIQYARALFSAAEYRFIS